MSSGSSADSLYESTRLGSYNRLNFEVRLESDLRAVLDGISSGLHIAKALPQGATLAFGVYFHETIHWWQHIGTTTGLMLSFAYPAQSHVNFDFLCQSLKDVGPKKSILGYLKRNYEQIPDTARGRLNSIVNNWHDVEFNCRLIIDPLGCDDVVNNPLYECVGHSLEMGLAHTLWLLQATFDRDASFLPDSRKWENGFKELRDRKVNGFFYGGSTERVPLGAKAIFEGQARFSEVQFLYLASGRKHSWRDFDQMGFFGEIYMMAFDRFLEWSKLEWPDNPGDSTVQLFLLVCDLALNPSDGYPCELVDFQSFIISGDPGYRFYWFCREIAQKKTLRSAIRKCSSGEYDEVANFLCSKLVCGAPHKSAGIIAGWATTSPSIGQLMKEEAMHRFGDENLPVRVCFAKHIKLMQDKVSSPEFFCWPGMHMVEHHLFDVNLVRSTELFERHKPLFIADLDGEIRPTILDGKPMQSIQETFDAFYRWNVLYDLVRQWIVCDGPFSYDYSWLTKQYTQDKIKQFADSAFIGSFKATPDSFTA